MTLVDTPVSQQHLGQGRPAPQPSRLNWLLAACCTGLHCAALQGVPEGSLARTQAILRCTQGCTGCASSRQSGQLLSMGSLPMCTCLCSYCGMTLTAGCPCCRQKQAMLYAVELRCNGCQHTDGCRVYKQASKATLMWLALHNTPVAIAPTEAASNTHAAA